MIVTVIRMGGGGVIDPSKAGHFVLVYYIAVRKGYA